jgi:hypothetical protein
LCRSRIAMAPSAPAQTAYVGGLARSSYDGANRVVIALADRQIDKRRRTVVPWALDVATLEWTDLDPPKPWPEGQTTGRWTRLWYDADHNVHLFVNDVKRDRQELFDGGVTETWAYRYKQTRRQKATASEQQCESRLLGTARLAASSSTRR